MFYSQVTFIVSNVYVCISKLIETLQQIELLILGEH